MLSFRASFFSPARPTYSVADGGDVIPIEVKSGEAPRQPYASHVPQLAAPCLLVEECCHRRPACGIIKYSDRAFEVDYPLALDNRLVATLNRMRDDLAPQPSPAPSLPGLRLPPTV